MRDLAVLDRFRHEPVSGKTVETNSENVGISLPCSYHGKILCFDQTLGHTGWAVLKSEDGRISVESVGDFKREKPDKGFAGNFALSDELIADVFALAKAQFVIGNIDGIVYEMPAVMGHRTDSSLMAATVVSGVATLLKLPHEMVNRTHANKFVTGNHKATKAQVKARMIELLPELSTAKPCNTNVTDAVSLGYVWMMEH